MNPSHVMRVARPTDNLAAITKMYAKGLGFKVLASFTDHAGFDGAILAHPQQAYHLEFTSQRGHVAGRAPTKDHLLVFYIPDRSEWEENCARMLTARFQGVSSQNPYWDIHGRTFEDIDGYRVVLYNAEWTES
jgi:hypothetical protein